MQNKELVELFKKKNLTLGSAESITCGLFASSIGEVSGASAVFKGGLVTYASEVKVSLLGVSKDTIDTFGVVSKEVAIQMAALTRNKLDVDVAISFTGNAGPTICKGDAPVGRVYIGISSKEGNKSFELNLEGSRNEIREATVKEGIELLIKEFQ